MGHKQFMTPQIEAVVFSASLLLMPLLIQIAVVRAAPETVVRVEPYTSSANVGETFTINITVVDVQNLYGIEVTLYWNSSILKAVNTDVRLGQTSGVLYNPIYIVENSTQKGKYVLAGTSTAPAPSFSGSGNIVRITFNVANLGNCKLDLETQLYDYPPPDREPRISLPIEHTTIDGFFGAAIPEIPNITILLTFMILTALGAIFSQKTLLKTYLQSHSRRFPTKSISRGKVSRYSG